MRTEILAAKVFVDITDKLFSRYYMIIDRDFLDELRINFLVNTFMMMQYNNANTIMLDLDLLDHNKLDELANENTIHV